MTSKPVSRWSLSYTGNRVLYAALIAVLAYVTTGSGLLFVIAGVLTFGLLTIFFAPRRQAGTDRQP